MIYSLAQGDITKRKTIENDFTIIDALEWTLTAMKVMGK